MGAGRFGDWVGRSMSADVVWTDHWGHSPPFDWDDRRLRATGAARPSAR